METMPLRNYFIAIVSILLFQKWANKVVPALAGEAIASLYSI